MNRISYFKDLTVRTVERLSGKNFRKSGPIAPEHKKIIDNAYITSFHAASMAFRLKFGNPREPKLPGFSSYSTIIDDITANITLINDDKIDTLKERIKETAYFDNFLAITKELAPDGNIVNLFGITSIKQGQERKTPLTVKREKISEVIRVNQLESGISENKLTKGSNQTVTGILKVANATTNTVQINSDGLKINMKVPDGLSDIVRKYWDEKVIVDYYIKNQKENLLVNIEAPKE